jgi:hypothetical protein
MDQVCAACTVPSWIDVAQIDSWIEPGQAVQAQGRDAGQASKSQETAAFTTDPEFPTVTAGSGCSVKLMERGDGDCSLRAAVEEYKSFRDHRDSALPPCTPEQPQQTCFGRSDLEHVKVQYSKIGMLGLRSLPDALKPNFRERLFAELVSIGQARRQQQRQKMSSNIYASAPHPDMAAALMPLLAHSTKGPPLQTPACSPHKSAYMHINDLILDAFVSEL